MPEGARDSSSPGYGTPADTPSNAATSSTAGDPIPPTDANISQQEFVAARESELPDSQSPESQKPEFHIPSQIPDFTSNAPPPPPPPLGHPRVLLGHGRGADGRGADGLPKSAYISSVDRKRDRVARISFSLFFLLLAGGAIYLGREWETEKEIGDHIENAPNGWAPGNVYKRFLARARAITTYYEEPVFDKLLPDPLPAEYQAPYTLVLGLEDLLIHTEWDKNHGWRSAKRPGLDYFLGYLSMYYELVVFSDSPSHLVIPIADKLGQYPGYITHFLAREATRYKDGKYIKVRSASSALFQSHSSLTNYIQDLSHLNRDLSKVLMLDTKSESAEMQPDNAIIVPQWKGDPNDRELLRIIDVLEFIAALGVPDVRPVIKDFGDTYIPAEFSRRETVARKKYLEQVAAEKAKKGQDVKAGFLSSLLGIKPPPEKEKLQEKTLQDLIREKGQENYKRMLVAIEEQRPKIEAEEKQRQKELAEASKTSLSKILSG